MHTQAENQSECFRAPLVAPFHPVVYVCVLVQEVVTIKRHKQNFQSFQKFIHDIHSKFQFATCVQRQGRKQSA